MILSDHSRSHVLHFLIQLKKLCHFHSLERQGEATNSELRRWFERGSVEVNGRRANWDDTEPDIWISLVLHPASKKRRCTLW